MKIVRYNIKKNKNIHYGILDTQDEKKIYRVDNPFKNLKIIKNQLINKSEVDLQLPLNPSKIICLAQNFKKNNKINIKLKKLIFIKTSNTLIGNKKKIFLPFKINTWGESELGIVIKKKM